MKRLLWILPLLAVLIVPPWYLWTKFKATKKLFDWKTEKAETGEIVVVVNASGTVEPIQTVQVGSQVSGQVKMVMVQADDHVEANQVIALLDDKVLKNEYEDRKLQCDQASNAVAQLIIERENADIRAKRLLKTRERVAVSSARAQATFELAQKNVDRYQDLMAVNATSQVEVDLKRLERDNALRDNQLQELDLKTLDLDLQQIDVDRRALEQRINKAGVDVRQANQALEKAGTNLGYTSIQSPIKGVVLERAVDPGQTIAAQFQAPNLFKIISPLDHIRITAQIDEADVGKLRSGQKVSFEVDAFREQKFTGVVTAVRLKNELRSNLVTYPVLIEADNPPTPEFPNGKLRPGMTAFLTFEVEKRSNVLKIPSAAVRFAPPEGTKIDIEPLTAKEKLATADKKDGDKKEAEKPKGLPAAIYLSQGPGKVKQVQVRVGDSDGKYYEMLSGDLKSGTEVIVGQKDPLMDALLKDAKEGGDESDGPPPPPDHHHGGE